MSTSDASRKPLPLRVGNLAVEVTGRCNRNCVYCYNAWKGPAADPAPADLPAADLVALVDRVLGESGLDGVQFTGGEPLLRDDFFAIVEGLARHGRRLSLVTDGGLVDDATVRVLSRLGVGPVQPTLLAADREIHDRMKGAVCFDATVEGIARLVAGRVPVSVSFVCTRVNHACFADVVDLCFALGVRTLAFSRFCTAGNGLANVTELEPEPDQVAACLDVAEDAMARRGMTVHVAISLPLCIVDRRRYPHLRFGRCAVSSGRPGYTMDPRGRLRPCSVSPVVLGDLRSQSWGEILDRARGGYLAEMARIPAACRACGVVDRCGGGCRESAIAAFSDPDRADPLARMG